VRLALLELGTALMALAGRHVALGGGMKWRTRPWLGKRRRRSGGIVVTSKAGRRHLYAWLPPLNMQPSTRSIG